MNNMKKFSLILLLVSIAMSVAAQPDLEQCKEMARKHYPLIRQYDLISASKEFTMTNASRAWLPQIGLSAQATYQSDVAKWPDQFESMLAAQGLDMPGLRKDQYKVQLDIQQTIWDGGKSRTDKEIASAQAQQEAQSVEVELYSVEKRVEDLYFGILMMQEQRRQIEEMMERLQTNMNHVVALVENGVAMQADADAIEVQILTANQNLSQVKANEVSFRKMLGLFIGEELGGGELTMPTGVEPMGTESDRPELKMFEAQLDVLKARENMLDVALMPKFGLFAQGYYGSPGLNMFENMMSSKWSLNGIVGVKMSWNISSFYTLKNQRREIDNAISGINLKRDVFTFNNTLQAEQENAEITRIRTALKDDDRIVELRGRVREAAEARLEEGVIDMNTLLTRISEESAAKIARSTHEIELMKAIYDLKHTLNR